MPREPDSSLPTITVVGRSQSFDIWSRSDIERHARYATAGTFAASARNQGAAAATRILTGARSFNFADMMKWANRFRRGASFNPTPVALAALAGEVIVIAGIKYFEKNPPMTPQEIETAQELVDQASNMFFATSYAQNLFADSLTADGALTESEIKTLEGLTGLSWNPTPAPVPIENAQGLTLSAAFQNNELRFAFSPLGADTLNKSYDQMQFAPISQWSISPGKYEGSPIQQTGTSKIPGSTLTEHGAWQTTLPSINTGTTTRYPGRTIVPARTVSYTFPANDVIQKIMAIPGMAQRILTEDITSTITDTLWANLPEFIPLTNITVRGAEAEQLLMLTRARTNTKEIARAVEEANTKRKDKKKKDQNSYLAALNWINKTWGTITELDDLSLTMQDNLVFTEDTQLCTGITDSDTCIMVKAGQKISDLPLKYKGAALSKQMDQGYSGETITLDFEGFITDYALMQVTDIAIALQTQLERGLIDQVFDSNPLTDYGNLSTWVNRAQNWSKNINEITKNTSLQE